MDTLDFQSSKRLFTFYFINDLGIFIHVLLIEWSGIKQTHRFLARNNIHDNFNKEQKNKESWSRAQLEAFAWWCEQEANPSVHSFINWLAWKNAAAVLWEPRDALLSAFLDIGSISPSSLHYHLTKHASLTLKKLRELAKARNTDTTLQQRKERVLQWKEDEEMIWEENCVFIDEASFNTHIRRNFGRRSKIGQPAKVELPNNRGITVTIVRRGVIDLTLRKPKAVQRKVTSDKKR